MLTKSHINLIICFALIAILSGCASSTTHPGMAASTNAAELKTKDQIIAALGLPDNVITDSSDEGRRQTILVYFKGATSSTYLIPTPAPTVSDMLHNYSADASIQNADLVFFLNDAGEVTSYVKK